MTIWKFPFEFKDRFELTMPVGAQILTVQMQGDNMVMWAAVDPKNGTDTRKFCIIGTGWEMPNPAFLKYINTVQDANGLVWHLFERLYN